MFYTVNSNAAAWRKADEIFPTDYEYDSGGSHRAGYNVFWSTRPGYNGWISDLGDRLEVNFPNGDSVNIWIEEKPEFPEYAIEDALKVIDEAIYQIDDMILPGLQKRIGMDKAREQLYAGYKALADLLKKDYPGSKLYDRYNLAES